MKLVASVIVRNELDRYLRPFLRHLAAFCDEIRILDDASTDEWADRITASDGVDGGLTAEELDRLHVLTDVESRFFTHEGLTRQALLAWTLEGEPTHVLAIDADEFVSDGATLRLLLERRPDIPAWSLTMQEVWKAADECLCVRQDGGWRQHEVPILWRVPGRRQLTDRRWRIPERKLASGREPQAIRELAQHRQVVPTGAEVLHFGWANEADRQARYDRYATHDGGRFHASTHLKSILWPDRLIDLEAFAWPEPLAPYRPELLTRAHRGAAVAA